MSKRAKAYLLTWSMLFAVSSLGQGAGPTQTTSRLPDNPQSLAHIDAAKKIANGDPVLMNPVNFFCAPVDYNKPGPELEPIKVFDNLYAIPSSPVQITTVWALTTRDGITV